MLARDSIESRPGTVVYKHTGTSRAEFAETRIVGAADLDHLDGIRSASTTFQDFVDTRCDLRVMWVDGVAWTVRIDSRRAPVGWTPGSIRSSISPARLHVSVGKPLTTLMGALGLEFRGLDLRLGTDGEYYFREVNPQGRFAYLEIKPGLPLLTGLGNLLVRGDGTVPGCVRLRRFPAAWVGDLVAPSMEMMCLLAV